MGGISTGYGAAPPPAPISTASAARSGGYKGNGGLGGPITRPVSMQTARDFEFNQGAAHDAAMGAADLQKTTGADWSVDQYGNTSYKSGMAPVAVGTLESTLSRVEGSGGSGPGAPVGPASYVPASAPQRAPGPDNSLADSAAFARAKDRTAQTARASMNAIRDVIAERGIQGGGTEAKLTGDVVGRAQGQLGDFDREAILRDFDRSNELSDSDYAAAVQAAMHNSSGATSMNDANANRAVTQRGQDMNAGNNRVASLQALAQMRNLGVVY